MDIKQKVTDALRAGYNFVIEQRLLDRIQFFRNWT